MGRDWPDILGGLALAVLGASAAAWAAMHYDLGTLRRMGPGFFPVLLGTGLAALGLIVAISAWRRAGEPTPVHPQAAAAVVASILLFGLGLARFGLVAATAAAVLTATLPAPRRGLAWRLLLTVAVTALTVLTFSFGLRMTLPLWPRVP